MQQKHGLVSDETLIIIAIGTAVLLGSGATVVVAAADWLGSLGVLIRPAPVEIPFTKGWGFDIPRALIAGGIITALGTTLASRRIWDSSPQLKPGVSSDPSR